MVVGCSKQAGSTSILEFRTMLVLVVRVCYCTVVGALYVCVVCIVVLGLCCYVWFERMLFMGFKDMNINQINLFSLILHR